MSPDRARAETLFFDGNRRLAEGRLDAAEADFRAALALAPDFAEALANLGYTLAAVGANAEAEAHYRRSLALAPDCAQVHHSLGVLLAAQKRYAEAGEAYRRALTLEPGSAVYWTSLGALFACAHKDDEAEQCHRTALAADADCAMAAFNLAYVLLRQGRFEEGWRMLDARDWYAALSERLPYPRWQGEPLVGRSILVGVEAGYGDMIQFCRYVPVLKSLGAARVGLICHPPLKRLFASIDGLDALFTPDDWPQQADWDVWTPPLSIPRHCGTTLDNLPATLPYLHADPDSIASRAHRLPVGGPRIGLCWKGNPRFENDAERSLPSLAALAPLAAACSAVFVSLQKGAGEDEAAAPPDGMPLFVPEGMDDFADTAAIIANLDLVISVDTAVAHLAGALGVPCWLLLPDYKTDWRWLTERGDSPWYPGAMRLFRQSAGGDWTPVIDAVAAALAEFVRGAAR
jgi:Tfp pilus assembly protein PilF